jgi:hypothetical protein
MTTITWKMGQNGGNEGQHENLERLEYTGVAAMMRIGIAGIGFMVMIHY